MIPLLFGYQTPLGTPAVYVGHRMILGVDHNDEVVLLEESVAENTASEFDDQYMFNCRGRNGRLFVHTPIFTNGNMAFLTAIRDEGVVKSFIGAAAQNGGANTKISVIRCGFIPLLGTKVGVNYYLSEKQDNSLTASPTSVLVGQGVPGGLRIGR